jgi:hypothetical protein
VSTDDKFARYRLSAKGQAAAKRRNARVKAARAARRTYRHELQLRANRARALDDYGRYCGPIPDGCHVPSIGDLPLRDFYVG